MTTVRAAGLEARATSMIQPLVPVQAVLGIVLAGLLGFVLGYRIWRSQPASHNESEEGE